jgi:DNA-binding IscR family transcriptional regulator
MAVHVLAVLAYKGRDGVTSALLAASVNTNPVVVRRLLLALQRANLVETRKGAGFGSRLSCPPNSIDLAQVFRAVEEDQPFVMAPGEPDMDCPVGQCIQSELGKVFGSARAALERDLARTTLAAILDTVKDSRSRAMALKKVMV